MQPVAILKRAPSSPAARKASASPSPTGLADEGCRALALVGRSQEKGDKAVAASRESAASTRSSSAPTWPRSAACARRRIGDQPLRHASTHWSMPPLPRRAVRWSKRRRRAVRHHLQHQCARAVLPDAGRGARICSRRKTPGSIVNVLSMSAHCGQSFLTPYSASKGALMTLTKNVANAYRGNRIRCNAVLPGWMDTRARTSCRRNCTTRPTTGWKRPKPRSRWVNLVKPDQLARLISLHGQPAIRRHDRSTGRLRPEHRRRLSGIADTENLLIDLGLQPLIGRQAVAATGQTQDL